MPQRYGNRCQAGNRLPLASLIVGCARLPEFPLALPLAGGKRPGLNSTGILVKLQVDDAWPRPFASWKANIQGERTLPAALRSRGFARLVFETAPHAIRAGGLQHPHLIQAVALYTSPQLRFAKSNTTLFTNHIKTQEAPHGACWT